MMNKMFVLIALFMPLAAIASPTKLTCTSARFNGYQIDMQFSLDEMNGVVIASIPSQNYNETIKADYTTDHVKFTMANFWDVTINRADLSVIRNVKDQSKWNMSDNGYCKMIEDN